MENKRKELISKIDAEIQAHKEAYSLPYAREKDFQTKLISVLHKLFGDDIWFTKISDRYMKGVPDIIGCIDEKFFALELKRDKGTPSMLQEYNVDKIKKAGGKVCIVKTVVESLEIIKSCLLT